MAPSDRERDRRTTLEDAREITCREFMDIPGVLIVGSGCRWTAPKKATQRRPFHFFMSWSSDRLTGEYQVAMLGHRQRNRRVTAGNAAEVDSPNW